MATDSHLTQRQVDVLTLVALGNQSREIGEILGVCKNTVDSHILHICAKLTCRNRCHAVYKATRLGILPGIEEL